MIRFIKERRNLDKHIKTELDTSSWSSQPSKIRDDQVGTEIPLFSVKEVAAVTNIFGNRKASGPDGIAIEVTKILAKQCPFLLLNMYWVYSRGNLV